MAGSLAAAGASAEVMRGYLAELDWRGFALSDVVGRLAARLMRPVPTKKT